MLEAGIVGVAILTVWLVLRAADRWGDRETNAAEAWATIEAWQTTKERRRAETQQRAKQTVRP